MTGGGDKTNTLMDRLRARVEWAEGEGAEAFANALLKARAQRLAKPRNGDAVVTLGQDALCCRVASERYAILLDCLSEVMPLGAWTPVPGQPQYLLGITNLRGEIRPVMDLHSLLGLEPPPAEAKAWVVFVKENGVEVGLRIDAVERIIALDPAQLTRPHETANGLPQRLISGIAPDALILLDIRQIFALDVLKDDRADARRAS